MPNSPNVNIVIVVAWPGSMSALPVNSRVVLLGDLESNRACQQQRVCHDKICTGTPGGDALCRPFVERMKRDVASIRRTEAASGTADKCVVTAS
jgi:hypothetical protein